MRQRIWLSVIFVILVFLVCSPIASCDGHASNEPYTPDKWATCYGLGYPEYSIEYPYEWKYDYRSYDEGVTIRSFPASAFVSINLYYINLFNLENQTLNEFIIENLSSTKEYPDFTSLSRNSVTFKGHEAYQIEYQYTATWDDSTTIRHMTLFILHEGAQGDVVWKIDCYAPKKVESDIDWRWSECTAIFDHMIESFRFGSHMNSTPTN